MVKQAKPVDITKMKELLAKLRKGADSSLTIGKLREVLYYLGDWKVEPIVALVPIHYTYQGHIHLQRGSGGTESEPHPPKSATEAIREKVLQREVRALPAKPVEGRSYVMDVGLIEHRNNYGKDNYDFSFKEWMGAPGFRFTAPNGKTFELTYDWHDYRRGNTYDQNRADIPTSKNKLSVSDTLRWLKSETPYLEQINEALGTREHVPGEARTKDHTGTCTFCYRNVKLGVSCLALHGYQRPGSGEIHGKCYGTDYPAYELSDKGCLKKLAGLQKAEKDTLAVLKAYQAGKCTSLKYKDWKGELKTVHPGESAWDEHFGNAVHNTENKLKFVRESLKEVEKMIRVWKVRPLPVKDDFPMPPPMSAAFDRWIAALDKRAK